MPAEKKKAPAAKKKRIYQVAKTFSISNEALIDFLTENTDTVYCAREEALEPIGFEYEGEVPYADFSMPFRTELTKGASKIIIAGTPVGPLYRPLVVQGIYDALTTVLQGKEWPQLTS